MKYLLTFLVTKKNSKILLLPLNIFFYLDPDCKKFLNPDKNESGSATLVVKPRYTYLGIVGLFPAASELPAPPRVCPWSSWASPAVRNFRQSFLPPQFPPTSLRPGSKQTDERRRWAFEIRRAPTLLRSRPFPH